MTKPKSGTTYAEAVQRLPMVLSRREVLLQEYFTTRAAFYEAHENLAARYRAMVAVDASLKRHKAVIDRLRRIVDGGPPHLHLVEREIDGAPLMTDADFLHHQQLAREQAEKDGTEPALSNIGKSRALFNWDAFIGGWNRYPDRHECQDQAAARLMSLYEQSQLGGAKANDMSQPYVDRSGQSASSVADNGHDARMAYGKMRKAMGSRTKLLEAVVVGRVTARVLAAERLGKSPFDVSGRQVAITAQEVRDAMTDLAIHFEFAPAGDKIRLGTRNKKRGLTGGTKSVHKDYVAKVR